MTCQSCACSCMIMCMERLGTKQRTRRGCEVTCARACVSEAMSELLPTFGSPTSATSASSLCCSSSSTSWPGLPMLLERLAGWCCVLRAAALPRPPQPPLATSSSWPSASSSPSNVACAVRTDHTCTAQRQTASCHETAHVSSRTETTCAYQGAVLWGEAHRECA